MKKCPFCAEEIQDEAIVCKHCGRDLPGYAQPMTEVPVSNKNLPLMIIAVMVLALVAYFYIRNQADKITGQLYDAVGGGSDVTVRYEITGDAGKAVISYSNQQGGIEQITDANLTWRTTLNNMPSGSVLSLGAQSAGAGKIACRILLDGQEFKESISSGEFAVVNCNGVIP